MKISHAKRILIISLILNILLVLFSYYQYKVKDGIKRDMILVYTSNQGDIKDDLSNVLKGRENIQAVMESLTQAKGWIMENRDLLTNNASPENQSGLAKVEKAYYFNRKGLYIVDKSIISVTHQGLTQENISDIEAYISALDLYTKELNINYETIRKKSSKYLLNIIRSSINKIQF